MPPIEEEDGWPPSLAQVLKTLVATAVGIGGGWLASADALIGLTAMAAVFPLTDAVVVAWHWVKRRGAMQKGRRDRLLVAAGLVDRVLVSVNLGLLGTLAGRNPEGTAATYCAVALGLVGLYAAVRRTTRRAERALGLYRALPTSKKAPVVKLRTTIAGWITEGDPDDFALGSWILGLVMFAFAVASALSFDLPHPDGFDRTTSRGGARAQTVSSGQDEGAEQEPTTTVSSTSTTTSTSSTTTTEPQETTPPSTAVGDDWCGGAELFDDSLIPEGMDAATAERAYDAGRRWPEQHTLCDPVGDRQDDGRWLVTMSFVDGDLPPEDSLLIQNANSGSFTGGTFTPVDPKARPVVIHNEEQIAQLTPRYSWGLGTGYLYDDPEANCGAILRNGQGATHFIPTSVFEVAIKKAERMGALPVLRTSAPDPEDDTVSIWVFQLIKAAPGTADGVEFLDQEVNVRYAEAAGLAHDGPEAATEEDGCPRQADSAVSIAGSIDAAIPRPDEGGEGPG